MEASMDEETPVTAVVAAMVWRTPTGCCTSDFNY
jgi:hypothetical protein